MKRLLCIVSVFLLLLIAVPVIVGAETVYTYNGYSFTYLENGMASICGWDNSDRVFVVPDKVFNTFVLEIDRKGLQKNTFITSVDFSHASKLLTVGGYAFEGCTSLSGCLTLPKKIGFLGDSAFMNCSSLESLEFFANTETVPRQCFKDCTSMTNAVIHAGPVGIEAYAFQNCSSLKSVTIPKTVTSINSTAFDGCGELTIVCYNNSCAMQYAIDHGIDYDVIDPLKGDFDGDGDVTVNDATYIQMNDVGMSIPFTVDKHALKRGEVTGDSEVDVRDATMVQMKLANMISSFD